MEFKFKSQVATTREQGQKLLDMGILPETADMVLVTYLNFPVPVEAYLSIPEDATIEDMRTPEVKVFPAWSLHRLMEMSREYVTCPSGCNEYDHRVNNLELEIAMGFRKIKKYVKEGFFNEYDDNDD